jgi:NAD(P)-dependent dehydrogenase (short-subunit alcohol dehydrogenase family)
MSDAPEIAVVTGANRGLGLETCRQLAARGITVVLTSRDPARGEAAARALRAGGLDVVFHPLDVTDPGSAARLADFVAQRYGRLDILVNNAGIAPDGEGPGDSLLTADPDTFRRALETNTLGALVPLMRGHGNVVNVSSGMGQLSDMNSGWPAYRVSKTALNALTRILADESRDTRMRCNCVCPGWVRTDMGGSEAPRGVEEGAAGIVWAATLPEGGPTGGFFRDGQPIPW